MCQSSRYHMLQTNTHLDLKLSQAFVILYVAHKLG